MSKQALMMKYHPAKKEVEFRRFQDGKEIVIRSDSILRTKYMNKKGNFVLQDYGNEFFDDIADAFDGLETVDIQVTTTRIDFEDFKQMVEYYNEDGKCKINATLIAELPDMKQAFEEAIKCGNTAIAQLQYHDEKISDFYSTEKNQEVRKSAQIYRMQIQEEVDNIKEKITSMTDNTVNLCFSGVYSSGKSALINAILGYKILPENIKSETARMFRISSPKQGENVKICFDLANIPTELEWNSKQNMFDISMGPNEISDRKKIQEKIYQGSTEEWPQYVQIRELLSVINTSQLSSAEVKVYFPVSLDSETVQFTIYDTPGTDSNYGEHQQILLNALKEQRQSILIFVTAPDKIEGSGNNALLEYLKQAEQKDSKTSIDLGRSLFVINKADTVIKDARKILQDQRIKYNDDDGFSIKLSDKKLFFTAANYGYAAKAKKNNVATPLEESLIIAGNVVLSDPNMPGSFCYEQDRCASSGIATKRLQDRNKAAMKQAGDDVAQKLIVTSGLYALESEIREYGEKYASAVKAFAIIDSVDKALVKLTNQTNSLMDSNKQEIQQIQTNINELRNTINHSIEVEYNKMAPSLDSKHLPDEIRQKIKIDRYSMLNELVGKPKKEIDQLLSKHTGVFDKTKVKLREDDIEEIKKKIDSAIWIFTHEFIKNREKVLIEERDSFMRSVKLTIARNGNISESAKKIFLDIPEPKISSKSIKKEYVQKLYDDNKVTSRFLWMKSDRIIKEKFLQELDNVLTDIVAEFHDSFAEDYCKSLEYVLARVKSIFTMNLEQYSVNMKSLIQNRDAMMRLREKVAAAADSLQQCQDNLNDTIWKELEKNG